MSLDIYLSLSSKIRCFELRFKIGCLFLTQLIFMVFVMQKLAQLYRTTCSDLRILLGIPLKEIQFYVIPTFRLEKNKSR